MATAIVIYIGPHDLDLMPLRGKLVDMIDDSLAIAEKQVEVLKESRAYYVDARQNDISLMADAMKSRAHRRKDPSILVPFEKLLKYNGQAGEKAFQTRKKNEQIKAEQDEQPEAVPAPPAPPV